MSVHLNSSNVPCWDLGPILPVLVSIIPLQLCSLAELCGRGGKVGAAVAVAAAAAAADLTAGSWPRCC